MANNVENETDETREKAEAKMQETRAKAEDMRRDAEAKVEDIKENAGAQADAMLDETDKRMESVADSMDRGSGEVHSRSEQAKEVATHAGELVSSAGHKVAGHMSATAQYMQEHSTQDMAKQATKYAQEHPVVTGLGALLVLLLFWKLVK